MKCPKVYALYLPQYYETENNNKWWGKGYTEWVAVKKAEACFENHEQPVIPLDEKYYTLSDPETMRWQSDKASKYGVDGFVFYHYYFGNGRTELERPAKMLLENEDIHMPFCFHWVNLSWVRTWSKVFGDVWGESVENETSHEGESVLIEQKYGDEEDWKKHFFYLLPFFKDPRYIKIDGKPLFFIYNPSDISCLKQMITEWQKLARENGLEGIYVVGHNIYENPYGLDGVVLNEPTHTIRKLHSKAKVTVQNGVRCYDYKDFCEESLVSPPPRNIKAYFTGACGYDTTPRRGNKGEVLINNRPEIFGDYLLKLLKKAICFSDDFVVINAWNEWGEGMHLEPDCKYEYEYLECIKEAKEKISSMEPMTQEEIEREQKKYLINDEQEYLLGKFRTNYKILSKWVDLQASGELCFKDKLKQMGVGDVAIYGIADLGRKLFVQLQKENVDVRYAIDQYVGSLMGNIKVFRPGEELPEVGVIIVTAYDANTIREQLKKYTTNRIVTLNELLD